MNNTTPHKTPAPNAEDILAEAQRRISERGAESPPRPPKAAPTGNPAAQERQLRRANRAVFWLSKHWLALFNGFLAVFTLLAFLAPVLMHAGHEGSAIVIHRLYDPFCHQYPFRSWFLFGPQAAYPTDGMLSPTEMLATGNFLGNAAVGFKTALCQRCVAIYGMMALAGMLYSLLRRRAVPKALPIWAYIAFGLVPMGLDGGIQWLTYVLHWLLPGVLTLPHETTPFLRTLTGGLFGALSAAVLYPQMQLFFDETYETLAARYGWR